MTRDPMTYSEKLRDPRWQKKRLEILQRDNWKCRACGDDSKNLQVHHLVYRKIDPWKYPNSCYQTLCEDCHEIRQEITDKSVDAIRLALAEVPTDKLKTVAQVLAMAAMRDMHVDKLSASAVLEDMKEREGKNGN